MLVSAAKEEIAFPLAALLNPKPHQGLSSKNPAPHPALDDANSTVALGLRAGLLLNGTRQSERARYYGSALGRFTSPDPLLSSGTIYNPQTWNRYSYGLNNPLKYLDPTGLYVCNGDKSECKQFANALKDATKARDSFKKGSSQYNLLNSAINAYGKAGVDNGVSVQFGATRSDGAGDTNLGVRVDSSGSKITTADNPTGQNTIVTIDPSKNTSTDMMAVTAAHEGVHVSDGTALVGALPTNLAGSDAASVLGGPLNLTQYSTEFHAYQASSYTGQGLGFGSLSVGHGFEIWNSGWGAADAETMRPRGINGVLADPTGLYKVTPDAPGKKLIQ